MYDSGFKSSSNKGSGSKHFFGAKSRSIKVKNFDSDAGGHESELKVTK